MTVERVVRTTIATVMAVFLAPLAAPALEPLGVYEDWSAGLIRSDRWQGGQVTGGAEVKRVVMPDHTLLLRYRREGSTASDTGNTRSSQSVNLVNPAQINELEATITVTDLDMTTCAANNAGAATRAQPIQLLMELFNDGTTAVAGNRTGDFLAGVQAFRNGNSADPAGVMGVSGFLNRCVDASCATTTSIASNTLATKVSVGQTFVLRLKWDQAANQFLFGLDGASDVALPYVASDTAPANSRFVNMVVGHTTANCTAGAVEIDSTTRVGTVKTNTSAVIP